MPVADDEPLHDFPDRALRQLLPYPQHLRSLLRHVVPALADGFDYDRARLLEREFPLDDWRRRASDLLFLIPYRTAAEERWTLVCVLIEHQSKADPLMPLRTLLYAVLVWEREWKTWHEQPTPRAPLRLTPVLPIVFHTGPRTWSSHHELKDLLGEPAEFHAFAPQWQPLFWDLASMAPETLLNSGEEWLQALAIVRAEDASSEAFGNVYNKVLERLESLAAREPVRYYDLMRLILTWGLWRRPQEEREQIQQAAITSQRNAAHREEIRTMGQTIAEWYVEEGKNKGIQEGQLRALRNTLRIQLQARFQTVPEALQQRIEATTDLEKLQSCLLQVLQIHDLQELQL
jgi:hypothetical protein